MSDLNTSKIIDLVENNRVEDIERLDEMRESLYQHYSENKIILERRTTSGTFDKEYRGTQEVAIKAIKTYMKVIDKMQKLAKNVPAV